MTISSYHAFLSNSPLKVHSGVFVKKYFRGCGIGGGERRRTAPLRRPLRRPLPRRWARRPVTRTYARPWTAGRGAISHGDCSHGDCWRRYGCVGPSLMARLAGASARSLRSSRAVDYFLRGSIFLFPAFLTIVEARPKKRAGVWHGGQNKNLPDESSGDLW